MPDALQGMRGEKLIPIIRAGLSVRLEKEGLRVKEIASLLGITPPAVVQYLHGKRGRSLERGAKSERIIDALADKLLHRTRSGSGGSVSELELVEAADQIRTASTGASVLEEHPSPRKNEKVLSILRARLQLELSASERCLESAARLDDEYSKLLLRLIASDSLRHADVVSQIISLVELSHASPITTPPKEFLGAILQIEDKAGESSLREAINISHPVARLLLEWIDADEKKHERVIGKLVRLLQKES